MVTCVDEQSHELVKGWILNISPIVPPISQVFDIQAPRDSMKTYIVKYAKNKIMKSFQFLNHPIQKYQKYLFKHNRYKMLHYRFIELVKWIKQKLKFLLVMKIDQEIHLIVCYLESLIFKYSKFIYI
ncbi:unnamed protein product [Paramecium octaurelia]|uniref:Uncharacterized protein n=1 Tax=Paramecium octaurelia TaxID=43137 RepID=A0A8S1VJY5_PAROT|nr:unnamed protein product [Paramecium octaurelia]